MATSGVTTGTMTVGEVIGAAFDVLGLRAIGDDLPPEESAKGILHLNWMLKSWQADLPTVDWRIREVSWTHPTDTASVTLDPNYIGFFNIRRRVSNVDTPLQVLTADEYAAIPSKAITGTPTCIRLRKTISSYSATLWPVPNDDYTIYADAARVIEDVTALTQTLDVPQEWLETVFVCLAARLVAPFSVHITNPALAADIRGQAEAFYDRLKWSDTEVGSVFFTAA